ncbi:pilus assembly protein TadG-related protein [Jeongeupia wiesaeckerbachi]|uniref:pilus assembly protein TadG-related protein n=1 Tax=Jeongeupia wiesaeckerbachi TaxID=3051218 RepID=UPI003D804EA5
MREQRGGMIIAVVGLLMLAVVSLGAIDIGRIYAEKRELQKVADMAAMAAAQSLFRSPQAAALASAGSNGFTPDATHTLALTVGHWQPGQTGPLPASPVDAAQVIVSNTAFKLFFVPGTQLVSAEATAVSSASAAFSVGSGLAKIDSNKQSVLNSLFTNLLGKPVSLSIASYQALADSSLSVSQLAAALAVGSYDQLVGTQVSYEQLRLAMISALNTQNPATASLLQTLNLTSSGGSFKLIDTPSQPGLLSLGLADKTTAMNAQLNVLNVLNTALQQSNQNHFLDLGQQLNLPLGVATITADIGLTLIEPPVLAIGQPGKDSQGNWRTQAQTAQTRLGLVLGIKPLLLPQIDVPLTLTVASATAWLESVQCTSGGAADVVIGVKPSVACQGASNCLGGPAGSLSFHISSNADLPTDPPKSYYGGAGLGTLSSFLTGTLSSVLGALGGVVGGLLGTILSPLTAALDPIINNLLTTLGIRLNYADVTLISVQCGGSGLVN